ncbi:hypothetical protein ACFL3O_01175 [Candidatus Neomarinimicrobiota bacterium]
MAQKKNTRLYFLLGILGVLIIILILQRTVFTKKTKAKPPVVQKENNVIAETPSTVSNNRAMAVNIIKNTNTVVEEFQFDGDWKFDPFFYLNEDSLDALRDRELGQYTKLRLSGVSLLRDQGYSLINSVIMTETDTIMTASILKEGDEFNGFRVLRIAFDHVILRKGNRNIRLELDEY